MRSLKNIKLWFVDNPRGSMVVFLYRISNYASRSKVKSAVNWIWAAPILIIYRFITEFIFGYELPAATKIDRLLFIDHGYSMVINKHAVIGRNCRIKHGVTIGCQTMHDGSQGPSPVIGNHVDIGANALIIGNITIGDNVKIGAGAIVTKSVPNGAVVRGRCAENYL